MRYQESYGANLRIERSLKQVRISSGCYGALQFRARSWRFLGLQIIDGDNCGWRTLLALRAKNSLDSESPAWSILQGRLGLEEEPSAPPPEHAVTIAPVLMMPSTGVTLFAALPSENQRPTSLVGSIVVHAIAAAVLLFGFGYKPPITQVVQEHYTLRQLDLLMPPETRAPASLIRSRKAARQLQRAAPNNPGLFRVP